VVKRVRGVCYKKKKTPSVGGKGIQGTVLPGTSQEKKIYCSKIVGRDPTTHASRYKNGNQANYEKQ